MTDKKPIMMTNPQEIELTEKGKDAANLIVRQLNNKKMAIIKQKLKEIDKLNLMKDINKKRFKPVLVEIVGDKEHVYIDNKTMNGQRLVTFFKPAEPEINGEEFKTKLYFY